MANMSIQVTDCLIITYLGVEYDRYFEVYPDFRLFGICGRFV